MSRYTTRPIKLNSYIEDDLCYYDSSRPDPVNVPEHVSSATGVLDVNGDMIYREPRPIGFGRMEEWN